MSADDYLFCKWIYTSKYLTDGQIIPAGSNLIVAIMFLHRNPDLFPNPEEFLPERFMEAKSTEEMNPYSHIPFR